MNGGLLGGAWSQRAAARLILNASQAATGASGTFTVALNATPFDAAAPFANLAGGSLVVPAGWAGTYLATWGLNYAGGLGQFSQVQVNGTAAAWGSGSTRSTGAVLLQLGAGDAVTLAGQVSASEVFAGNAAGTNTWLALARYL